MIILSEVTHSSSITKISGRNDRRDESLRRFLQKRWRCRRDVLWRNAPHWVRLEPVTSRSQVAHTGPVVFIRGSAEP